LLLVVEGGGPDAPARGVALRTRGLVTSRRRPAKRGAWTDWQATDAGRAEVERIRAERQAKRDEERAALGTVAVPVWALRELLDRGDEEARRVLRAVLEGRGR
jgi:hypothetical protein